MAALVLQGDVCRIFGRMGFRHSNFETRRSKAIKPPGPRSQTIITQQSNNGRKGWGSSGQGGLYGRPFGPPLFTMFLSKHGEKKGWLTGGFEPCA